MPDAKYLWLDLETTGLDPRTDVVLELGYIVTDDELVKLDRGSWVIGGFLSLDVLRQYCSAFVWEMHTASGLVDEVLNSNNRSGEVDAALADRLGAFVWAGGRPILAGSSVHFDRGFLNEEFPLVDRALHHRHFDVSAIKLAFEDALGEPFPKGTGNHRAMADIESSLESARRYRDRIRGIK